MNSTELKSSEHVSEPHFKRLRRAFIEEECSDDDDISDGDEGISLKHFYTLKNFEFATHLYL